MNHYTYQHADAVNFNRHLHKGMDAIVDHITDLHKVMLPILTHFYSDLETYTSTLMNMDNDTDVDVVINDMLSCVEDTPYILQASPFPVTDNKDMYPLTVNTVIAGGKRQWVYLMVPYPTMYVAGALVKEKIMSLALAYRRSLALINTFSPMVTPEQGVPGPSSVTITETDFKAYRACMNVVEDKGYFALLKPRYES